MLLGLQAMTSPCTQSQFSMRVRHGSVPMIQPSAPRTARAGLRIKMLLCRETPGTATVGNCSVQENESDKTWRFQSFLICMSAISSGRLVHSQHKLHSIAPCDTITPDVHNAMQCSLVSESVAALQHLFSTSGCKHPPLD